MTTITERTEAINKLQEWIKPGDTVYTILRHRARSGMSRSISLVVERDGEIISLDYFAARAMDYKIDHDNGGLKTHGAGMDFGFELVYNLGRALYSNGFGCIGERCRSNDHSNGDRDFTPHMNGVRNTFTPGYVAHWHNNGGYAFRHVWL